MNIFTVRLIRISLHSRFARYFLGIAFALILIPTAVSRAQEEGVISSFTSPVRRGNDAKTTIQTVPKGNCQIIVQDKSSPDMDETVKSVRVSRHGFQWLSSWAHLWRVLDLEARQCSTVNQPDIRVLLAIGRAGTHDFDSSGAASI